MELEDRIVVVTGGASGIGRAMCERFAAGGAWTIVVVDREGEDATRVAESLDGPGRALSADVSVEADLRAVIERTEDEVGAIDLFVSNAGLAGGGGIDADDEVWSSLWSVNVMAHVYAARAVIPRMVERGGGYLLTTASAAGLLTNLGNAPYSVTKHAAVALAEWIAITFGDAGIKVSCLCPMGVDTPMLRAGAGELAGQAASTEGVITAERVADAAVEGLRDERFLILPHPEVADHERRRTSSRDRWLAGMRRLQASFTASSASGYSSPAARASGTFKPRPP